MAHRPKRTFRQRRADSSDSDSTQEPFAEPGAPREHADLGPAEEGLPSGGGRAEAAELPRRAWGRGRGRVWASSRHAARAAPRLDGGSDVPGDAGQQGGCPGRGVGRMGKEPAWFSKGFYNPLPTTNNDESRRYLPANTGLLPASPYWAPWGSRNNNTARFGLVRVCTVR